MGFGAPGLLPLLALAAIPPLIHILSRLRMRRVQFPSLLLLRTVRRERFSWVKLKEILLLILRTIALLALLAALARPYLERPVPGLGRAADIILVVDDSYSMTYGDRWADCLSASRELVRSLDRDRTVFLLTSSGSTESDGPVDKTAALALLDSLEPGFLAPTLEPVLERAAFLAESLAASVVAVTDLQQRSLAGDWEPGTDVTLYDIGSPEFDNAGIARLYPEDPFAVAGRPVRIKAELVNHGAAEISRTAVLDIGDRHEEQVLNIPPLSRKTITFETTVEQTGIHEVRLELRTDLLAADNVRHLVLRLPEQTTVLLVESARVSGRYLADALSADSAGFRVTVTDATELSGHNLRNHQVLLVADAFALRPADWTRVDFHLRSGGAALLMVGPADEADLGQYVRSLGPVRSSGFVSVAEIDSAHPVLGPIGLAPLAGTRVRTHARLSPEGTRVLARLSDNDPLILENRSHRLIVWAIGPTPDYSDLVHKAVFVPLLHRTVTYLARKPLHREHIVGDTIRLETDRLTPVVVAGPDGRTRLEPVLRNGQPVILVATRKPGVYRAETGLRPIAVNPLADEGNLEQLAPDQLESRGLPVRSEPVPESADLTVPLLFLAAATFVVELLLLLF